MSVITPSDSFSRPADTTQYAAGDLVANSTTAGSVTPLKFSLQRASGSGMIKGVRFYKSATSATAAVFNLHLFSSDPGTPTNGDNGVFAISSAENYIAEVEIDVSSGASVGTTYLFDRVSGLAIGVDFANTDGVIYGLIETGSGGTYTPASGETFKVTLEIERSA